MRRIMSVLVVAMSLVACGSDEPSQPAGSTEAPVATRPMGEVFLGYNCEDGTAVQISDSGWTVGTDPEIHPEPNTKGDWSPDELLAAAC